MSRSPLLESVTAALRAQLVPLFPCAMGVGIAVYFALPDEPGLVAAVAAAAALVVTAGLAVLLHAARPLAILAAAALLGFSGARVETLIVDTPSVPRDDIRTGIVGTIEAIDALPTGARIVLGALAIDRLGPEETPRAVRLTVRSPPPEGLAVGDRIDAFAILGPPPGPVLPGAFDFRRYAYFEGLGGVGVVLGTPRILDAGGAGGFAAIDALRARIVERVGRTLEGDSAAFSVAFLTGERAGISDEANEAMRDSGLAHLLSISGLHIALVALIVFGGLRLGLAAIEPVALRRPIKKWSAAAALVAITVYLLMIGPSVPAVRSTIMTGIVLVAVMLDRQPFSIRLVALAAIAVLLVAPDAMLGPSFQMSFAAVFALIAAWEALRGRGWLDGRDRGRVGGALRYLFGVLLTTLVATAATAPFAIFHFQRFALLSVVANLAAVPLTSFVVMPCVLAAYPLMAVGLGDVALVPLGWGMEGVLAIAEWTARQPGSAVSIPAMPGWGLAAAVAGGLFLCLARGPVRLAGLAGAAVAVLSLLLVRPPDLLVSDDARLVALRLDDGRWSFSSRRAQTFTREQWLRRLGAEEGPAWPLAGGASEDGRIRCDPVGCVLQAAGLTIAVPRELGAVFEDCEAADLVVYRYRAPWPCRDATLLLDGSRLAETGALAITLGPTVEIETVRDDIGRRPWTPWREE
jgi:competence protein ComEC